MDEAHISDASIDQIVTPNAPPMLRRFTGFWLARRRGRAIPYFDDLDPLDMPWALRDIFVLAARSDGTFVYQLVGQGMFDRLGPNLKNKTAFDVFEPDYAAWTDERWRRAAAERLACYVRTHHRTSNGRPIFAHRVLLPAIKTGPAIDRLIGVAVFAEPANATAADWFDSDGREIHWTPVDDLGP